jgi:beta-lactamase class C
LIAFWERFTAPKGDPPGTHYVYSDLGFITLGYAVAGNAYNTLLASTITTPLGLSLFGSAAMMPAGAAYAQGHLDQHGQTVAVNGLNTDLMASPTDFMAYLKAQMGLLQIPATLSKAITLTHRKVFTTPASTPINLGLSWQLHKAAPYTIDKDGASSKGGCQSYIGFIPGSNNGVVVLMNKFFTSAYPGYGVTALGRKILGILAPA